MSRRLRIALALVALLLLAGTASAYYTAFGTGGATASVGTLAAPSITSATPGAGTVALSWSAVTPPGAGAVTYYVRRDGGAASAACPSLASPTGVTSCTDTGVAVGAHSYTVTAKWRSWTGTSASANATVAYGPVTQLVVTTQPAGATGGTAFTTQPVVTARDASGNTVANYAGPVSLALKPGSPSGTLSGCSGALSGGVTTFSGCKIDKSGNNFALRATDGTRTVDSNNFNVAVGPVAQLAFTQQPSGAVAGSAFTTQPKVTAQDAGGNTVTTYGGTIVLSITSGTGSAGATLDNCARTTTAGVATFTSCEIKKSGTGYQLRANDGTRTADSAAFTVTPGAMASLTFTTQPAGATGGSPFTTQPVVTALDAEGNVATGYAGTIALTIRQPGTDGTLSGCTQTRSNGVVTFAGCKIAEIGTGYRLRAKDGTPQVDSNMFNVTIGPLAQFVLETEDTTPEAGVKEELTIRATDLGGNTVTSYTGAKGLTFGGASASLTGTAPIVTNSSGTAIAFGATTTISFSSGVASTSGSNSNGFMTLYKAETVTITVTDGTISGGVSVTNRATSDTRLAFTSVIASSGILSSPCFFTCTVTGMANSATFKATVSMTDTYGNVCSDVGSTPDVGMSRTAGTGGFPGSSTTLSMPNSGAATTAQFTYTVPSSGSWSTNAIAASASGYTGATASLSR